MMPPCHTYHSTTPPHLLPLSPPPGADGCVPSGVLAHPTGLAYQDDPAHAQRLREGPHRHWGGMRLTPDPSQEGRPSGLPRAGELGGLRVNKCCRGFESRAYVQSVMCLVVDVKIT